MSSLKDLASLIMIPSLVKDGRLDTVKPLGNSIIHPDATGNNDGTDGSTPAEGNFTFTRGSNLSATRVDASQLIEKGRENLLLQSNQFDTTWTTGATLTSGQSGYNGNNAWKFASSSGGQTGVQQSVSFSNIHTFSVYAKAGSVDFIKLFVVQSGTNRTCVIDLSDGSIANDNSVSASSPAASVTSLANGWYRIEMPTNANSATFVRIRPQLSEGDDNLSVGDFIYIQDTQLEQGLVATPYIETGASTAQAGILENTPRLDYSGGATCPSLLLEPSRTNIIPYSEDFSQSTWQKQSAGVASAPIVTINYAISPDGTLNASRVIFDINGGTTSSDFSQLTDPVSTNIGDVTNSVYIKSNTASNYNMSFVNALGGSLVSIVVTPEWQRFDITGTTISTSSSFRLRLRGSESTSDSADVSLWGAQIEQGSYPTSYIPTYGVSQTRSQEAFTRTGISSLINSQKGVFFVEMAAFSSNTGTSLLSLSDGGPTNNIYIGFTSTTNQISAVLYANGSAQGGVNSFSYDVKQMNKIAVSYKPNEFKLFINGSLVGTDTNATMPNANTLNKFSSDFGQGSFKLAAELNQAIIFPTALTDSECIALTTI